MSKFFYSESNYRQYKPTANWWQRLKRRKQLTLAKQQADQIVKLKNPYSKNKAGSKQKIAIVILVVLIITWLLALLYHPFFKITKIQYLGFKVTDSSVADAAIKQYMSEGKIFKNNMYFIADIKQITDRVNKVIVADKLEIVKAFPSTLKVLITERMSSVVYCTGQSYYLLDTDGNVIRDLNKTLSKSRLDDGTTSPDSITDVASSSALSITTNSTTPTATDTENLLPKLAPEYDCYPTVYSTHSTGKSFVPGSNILSAEQIKAVRLIFEELNKQGMGSIKYFSLEKPIDGLRVYIQDRPVILINPSKPLDRQLQNIKLLTEKFKPTEYIDVRFDDRLFWK